MGPVRKTTRLVGYRVAVCVALVEVLACSGDSSIGPSENGVGDANASPSLEASAADAAAAPNRALSFNGLGTYATTGTGGFPSGGAPQTISLWVLYSAPTGTQTFVSLRNDSGGGIKLGLRNGTVSAWTVMEGTTLIAAPKLPAVNKWHHIAYTFDGNDLNTLYVDGKVSANSHVFQNWNRYVASWLGSPDGLTDFYFGMMDEIRIWGVARTSSQVASEMKGQASSNDPNLAVYFNCDLIAGTRLPDNSGHGNDATLGGGDPRRMPSLVPSGVPTQ